jgi:hypothetical protein
MNKSKALITFCCFFVSITCFAQKSQPVDTDNNRLNKVCDSFMQLFIEQKITEAIRVLKNNSVIEEYKLDTLQVQIQEQLEYLIPSYGKMTGYELISEKKIKDVLSKRFYILKFENYYLRFEFMLYKRNTGWTVTNFKYSEDFDAAFHPL